jgi:hypothetical protein
MVVIVTTTIIIDLVYVKMHLLEVIVFSNKSAHVFGLCLSRYPL